MRVTVPNLLVSDDDDALRRVICESLQGRGFAVVEARDGAEAVQWLDRLDVHLCLVDFDMPRLTGLDVIRRVAERTTRPACLLMSANLTAELIAEAKAVDVYDVMSKPFGIKQLRGKVCQALRDVYGWQPEVA